MSSSKKPTVESIGRMVKKLRKERRLSQTQLGRLAFDLSKSENNKAQQRVKYIELAYQKKATIEDLFLLAEALNVEIEDLLKNE